MMTSMQRVMATLRHEQPDRVPVFFFTSLHGAKELGLGIRDYFSRAEHVVEGELRLRDKFRGDCLDIGHYAGLEAEAFGVETIFIEDGPPTCGRSIVRDSADIDSLQPPRVTDCAGLVRALETIRQLKQRVGESVPILGTVVAPFSLPVMQMGFDRYIELVIEQPDRFARLMQVNQRFCVEWANAQLAAGATLICYVDPLASTTNFPRDLYLATGHRVALDTLPMINGPTAIHLGSGRGLPIAQDLAATSACAVGVSTLEALADWKAAVGKRLTLIGNLNGVAMRRWTADDAEREVRQAIAGAGRGGGFILSDNHGEIPWQVPDAVLLAIRAAVDRWGRYPLDWMEPEA
ncbi:MAG TPA: uroporphyrinogen decarboxylase family protein [Noviherbaspirillum sp.]